MSIFERQYGKKFYFLMPFVTFVLYLVLTYGIGLLMSTGVRASIVSDLTAILAGLFVYLSIYSVNRRKGVSEPFKPRAWAVFLLIFSVILLWFLTQCMSLCISLNVENTGMDAYADVVASDTGLWVILALFIAPAAEEFIFRGFMYKSWTHCMNGFLAAVISSLIFAAIHGTWMHIPVAFMMGLFNAAIFELTGKLRYAVVCHVLYNFVSVSAIVPLSTTDGFLFSIWFNILMFMVLFVSIFFLYKYRVKIREYVTTPHLIDRLNRKWDEE